MEKKFFWFNCWMKSDLRRKSWKNTWVIWDVTYASLGFITCLHACSVKDGGGKHLLHENQQLPCAALHVPAVPFGYTTAPSTVLDLQLSLCVQTFHFTILYWFLHLFSLTLYIFKWYLLLWGDAPWDASKLFSCSGCRISWNFLTITSSCDISLFLCLLYKHFSHIMCVTLAKTS